ncbi:MAG: hypothetical protein NTX81_04150 [Candidatus Bathyarchaeota archaeon]|nr:hypothetical protein [Candidatus Bathyarchaeota archaeon]
MPPIEYLSRSPGLGLPNGPYDFRKEIVESTVLSRRAGNYSIGYTPPMGAGFVPKIVGGSDEDLQQELLQQLDIAARRGYDKFVFKYVNSPEERFEHECLNYHSFQQQLDNKQHPQPPAGTKLSCPDRVCELFFQHTNDK